MNQRGQTAYDYLLGVVLLLVAIITVLSLFPQIFGPFVESASSNREKMADRVATDVLEQTAVNGSDRTINRTKLENLNVERLKNQSGVPEFQSINVTVQGTSVQVGDERLGEQPSVTVTRTVRMDEGCQTGCQLTVRVW